MFDMNQREEDDSAMRIGNAKFVKNVEDYQEINEKNSKVKDELTKAREMISSGMDQVR